MLRTATVLFLLTLLPGAAVLSAQTEKSEEGAALGTWKLDLKKSDFGKMPVPKSAVVTVTDDRPTSLKWHATVIEADGKKTTESFTGAPDGKQYPVKGTEQGETMAYSREGDAIKATGKAKDGSTLEQTINMSDDKNTMTLKSTASGPKGEMSWTEVFDRIPSRAQASAHKGSSPKRPAKP